MSLFDLQDVCIAIRSIATLDLPMVVDLIGIYGLKGPYCTLTTTDWFLQALSVIPRGSWGDVARRFTIIRWAVDRSDLIGDRSYDEVAAMNIVIWTRADGPVQVHSQSSRPSLLSHTPPPCAAALRRRLAPPPRVAGIRSGRFDEENPFVQNSSVLLVQPDEGVSVLVVDRIGNYLPQSTEKSRVLVIPVGARHKFQQACTRRPDEISADGFSSSSWPEQIPAKQGGGARRRKAAFEEWREAAVYSIGYPRMSASGESSTTMHRLLHASGPHPIPPPNDPKTNQYNQDLGLIHSTNGNHMESPNEGSSIDHQVTIYLHAQNITMFPTNETWYFASQILVSISGGLILILTAQSTRN
ncbi:hypothetical protein F511_37314 [Dorcoceras hygrometricum]|uniref:Uncharacterized protein n=1 Tax=Dorcoceras hygrometricum TaxID=472368 RepID=A0A2Z7B3Q7_9LAMI|nr:hypothetical protein F511_37314 [Dorcoceras hygrometricum]